MFQTARSEEGAWAASAPILHSVNCSWPAGKDPTESAPTVGSGTQLPEPRLLSSFFRALLPDTCQNRPHLSDKEAKSKGAGGLSSHAISLPCSTSLYIQESLPAMCPALLACGHRIQMSTFPWGTHTQLKTMMAVVRGSYWALWECLGCRH